MKQKLSLRGYIISKTNLSIRTINVIFYIMCLSTLITLFILWLIYFNNSSKEKTLNVFN